MKTHISLTALILITFICNAQNPIPNSSFENWTNGVPDSWSTPNSTMISQVTPGYTGMYAVRIGVNNSVGGTLAIYPALPLSQAFTTFSFFYKFHNAGTVDQVVVVVYILNSVGNYIGTAQTIIFNSNINWIQKTIPVTYTGTNPGSFTVDFLYPNPSSNSNTYIIVDDVSLSTPTGLSENNNSLQAVLYPNPTSTELTVNFSGLSKTTTEISILDLEGRTYIQAKNIYDLPGLHSHRIDVSQLENGVYICKLNNEKGSISKKFYVMK